MTPLGKPGVVIVSEVALLSTPSEKAWVFDWPRASVTVIANVNVPTLDGVTMRVPVVPFREKPGGRALADHT